MTPQYRVTANGGDITALIVDRLVSMRVTDEAGVESDMLEIVLADHLAPIQMPATGAELEVALGYDGKLTAMGLFVVDEIELAGWPAQMTIRARGAPFEKSKGGKTNLQTQKTRSWDAGTTIGDMVKKIAGEHSLKPAVAASLADVELPHTDQTRESDLHLLQRIAKRHDGALKAAGGTLAMTKRGEGKTASGKALPAVTVRAEQCTAFRATVAKRDAPGTVKAFWQDTAAARRETAEYGDGDPVRELRQVFPTQAAAEEAARAEWGRRARGEATASFTLPGDPAAVAEAPLKASGFRPGVDGEWIISRVEHSLEPGSGYSMTIEVESKAAAD